MRSFSPRLAGTTLALGLATGALTACEGAPMPLPQPSNTIMTDMNADQYAQLPDGPCILPLDLEPQASRAERAKTCFVAEASGTVALVAYDAASQKVAERVAATLSTVMAQATGKIVNLKPTVLMASQAAIDKIDQTIAANGCLDYTDPTTYGSTVAAETMTETDTYTFVQAFMPYESCTPVSGVADQTHGRLSDIYTADIERRFASLTGYVFDPAVQASTHELEHLFGLGHVGSVSYGNGQEFTTAFANGQTDISALLAQGYTYAELEATNNDSAIPFNMMGDAGGNNQHPGPTAMQMNALLRPKAALAGKTEFLAKDVAVAPTTITAAEAQNESYLSVDLADPLSLQADKTNATSIDALGGTQFTKLTLVPRVSTDQTGPHIFGTDVYLSNENAQSAFLGAIFPIEQNNSRNFTLGIGSQKITASFDLNTLTASVAQR